MDRFHFSLQEMLNQRPHFSRLTSIKYICNIIADWFFISAILLTSEELAAKEESYWMNNSDTGRKSECCNPAGRLTKFEIVLR